MPSPKKGESEKDFVSRCTGDPESVKSFPDQKQRLAVCYSKYKDKATMADNPPHSPYGDVHYADPGFQSDKQKRYPLDSEQHIRAAWSYIHKGKDAGAYSAEQLAHIKSAIVTAWKDKVDPKGPPEADKMTAGAAEDDAPNNPDTKNNEKPENFDDASPYGDVHYADPGFQKDKQKRYPIDNEQHIRAAWSYIHQGKDAGAYSSEQVAHIKSAIETAWKDKIDPKGPPAAKMAGPAGDDETYRGQEWTGPNFPNTNKYGRYADAGMLADKQPRYPLTTPNNIKQAYSALAQPQVAKALGYTDEHIKAMRDAVGAAWRDQIDNDMPGWPDIPNGVGTYNAGFDAAGFINDPQPLLDTPAKVREAWDWITGTNHAVFKPEDNEAIRANILEAWQKLIGGTPPIPTMDGQIFAEMKNVEVFRVGTWKGSKTVTATSQTLDEMIHAFKELSNKVTGFRPMLKLGHADAQRFIGQHEGSGAPALGWIKSLRRQGDTILADFADVPPSVVDLIRRKLYNSVSIEILPSLTYDGASYKNVLSAVALLGAELPAVKGLKELSASLFEAQGAQVVTLSQSKEEDDMATYTQEQVDALVAAAVAQAKTKFDADHNVIVNKLTTDLKVANEGKEQNAAALEAFKTDAQNVEMSAFIDKAIADGKVMPVEKDGLVTVGKSMAAGTKVRFGDKEKSGLDAWKDMITARPVAVKMGTRTQGRGERTDNAEDASQIVAQRATEKVSAAGGADKLSYKDAVSAVLAQDPALKQRYFLEV